MKKSIKILSGSIAFLLIIGILYFANGLMGNPISKVLANNAAKELLSEKYRNLDLELEDAYYSFKSGHYYVIAKSSYSRDTHFTISINPFGKINYDSYEDDVLGKYNTYDRINSVYDNQVRDFFESEDMEYKSDIAFGEIKDKAVLEGEGYKKLNYGVEIKDLELDKEYDVYELGEKAGEITLYVQDEDISVKRASEILLDIKNKLDEEKISFYAIDFVLEKPREENEEVNLDAPSIRLDKFLYEDIYEKDLEKRVDKEMKETKKYYEEQDKIKLEMEN
ncbi:MAG: hypothetical protein ACRDD7_09960 [Peptostreptococcaceae bacterium]